MGTSEIQKGDIKEAMGLEISWRQGRTDHNNYEICVW